MQCNPIDERRKFIARSPDGEDGGGVREFGISRKTAYKILTCYDA